MIENNGGDGTLIPDDDEGQDQGGQQTTQEEQNGTGDVNRGQNNSAPKVAAGRSPRTARAPQTPAKGLPKTVRIILEDNEGIPPTGQFFGLNGTGYILQPGVPADVPQGIVDILNNAVMSTPIREPQTNRVIGHRDKLRYSYRVLQPGE